MSKRPPCTSDTSHFDALFAPPFWVYQGSFSKRPNLFGPHFSAASRYLDKEGGRIIGHKIRNELPKLCGFAEGCPKVVLIRQRCQWPPMAANEKNFHAKKMIHPCPTPPLFKKIKGEITTNSRQWLPMGPRCPLIVGAWF